MIIWTYDEPDEQKNYRTIRLTEQQILDLYWNSWSKSMKQKKKNSSFITEKNCIEDFIVTHWATKEESNDTKT